MSRHGGRDSDDLARGAGTAAARGAGLVVLAVIIGIVLLQVVDDGTTAPKNASAQNVTTTTTHRKNTTTTRPSSTTKAPVQPTRAPSQVRVIALNAGAPTGSGGAMHDALLQKGYSNQPEANTWNGAAKNGVIVYCKAGFEREAAALAIAAGKNAKVQPFPSPAPPFSANVDCVVAVGA
jgi:hypothetical protein